MEKPSGRSNVRKRQALTLQQKMNVIEKLEKGVKQVQLAEQLKIPRQTIQGIWRNRQELLDQFKHKNTNIKTVRKCEFEDVDAALLEWFKLQRNRCIPLDGAILLQKAIEFAKMMGKETFQGSSGWFSKWNKRHNISFRDISGESAEVDLTVTSNWIDTVFKTVSQKYQDRDIFNADETGLFFKALADKIFRFRGKTCSGGKHSKDRLTLLLCCNKDGSEKLKPLIIGKYANPRCFAKLKSRDSLPVYYYANSTAWMVTSIFTDWLHKVNKQMKVQKRNILLILDNCGSHPKDVKLTNVEHLYLSPNATSVIQPLDQGIINEVKRKYRRKLVQKVIRYLDWNIPVKINVLDTILLLHSSWLQVSSETIANCFRHAFESKDVESGIGEDETSDVDIAYEHLGGTFGPQELADYEAIDANVVTAGLETEETIVSRVQGAKDDSEEIESEPDANTCDAISVLSNKEALLSIEKLKFWMIAQDCCEPIMLESLDSLETFAQKCLIISSKQTLITNYFTPK